MEEKAPLARGDEQVLPITAAPFIVFLGFDRHKPHLKRSSSGISKQQIELFALGIPPDYDTETDSPLIDYPPPPPLLKQKLNPHVVMDLPQTIFFAALGSSVYCFGNVEAFDVSCPPPPAAAAASFFRCAPPPTVARCFPHTLVLDDKLYVMAGFMNDDENFHWMEVFDPKLGTWKALTNPPVEISTHAMVVTSWSGNKQIVVVSDGDPNHVCLTYDVRTDFWTVLDRCNCRLFDGGSCEPSSTRAPIPRVGSNLYWVKFGDCNDLVVNAYNLVSDEWFEGKLNMLQEVFGKREYLYLSSAAPPPGLIHLCDHKFCLPLQSWTRNEKKRDRRHFLYCVVLNISPILDENEEDEDDSEDNFPHNDIKDLFDCKKLHVSVHSSERYPMDHGVEILDTLLLNGSSLLTEASKAGARASKEHC